MVNKRGDAVILSKSRSDTYEKQVIVPTGQKLSYIDAFNKILDRGGLPPNRVHDDVLVRSRNWRSLLSYYPAWAREILVYPEAYGKFEGGKDVVDAYKDRSGRSWVLTASSIPEEAIDREGGALFIEPQSIKVGVKKVIIKADSKATRILSPFMQKSGWGVVDEDTRVPLGSVSGFSPYKTKRYLWRIDGAGVRPLVREWSGLNIDYRRYVYSDYGPDNAFGVGLIDVEQRSGKSR